MNVETTRKGRYRVLDGTQEISQHNDATEAQTVATNEAMKEPGKVFVIDPPVVEVVSKRSEPVILPAPDTFERGRGSVVFVATETEMRNALARANPDDTIVVKAGARLSDSTADWARAFSPARDGRPEAPIRIVSEIPRQATLASRDQDRFSLPAISINARSYIHVLGFKIEGVPKVIGEDNFPDGEGAPHGKDVGYCRIEGNEITVGGPQGTDDSLTWGLALHTAHFNIVRNNLVHQLRGTGNRSENTGAVMLFCSSDNLIENNTVDAGGVVCSVFGQKAGNCHRNVLRYNRGRGGEVGFTGKGGTGGTTFCNDNEIYGNIIEDCESVVHLNHNAIGWRIYNNTAVRMRSFLAHGFLSNHGMQYWNNIVSGASYAGYFIEEPMNDWSRYIRYSDFNLWHAVPTFARWNWGHIAYPTLAEWVAATGMDTHSIISDPGFINNDYRLRDDSPARGRGRNGENIGAYRGNERIGIDWT